MLTARKPRLLLCLLLLTLTMSDGATPCAASGGQQRTELRVLSFNILQGGGDASNVGFSDQDFGGSRYDELAAVIHLVKADVVAVQEDDGSGRLLASLGKGWKRQGSIYSRYDLVQLDKAPWLAVCRVQLTESESVVIANCHWRPSDYGPFQVQERLQQEGAPRDVGVFEQQVLAFSDKTAGDRGYRQTLEAIQPWLDAEENLVLCGDFNEPSHLDWTARAASEGMDRWVRNPSGVPLRFPIRWTGSRRLADAGLRDAYRTAYPDEVRHPGNTWTPSYPDGTPGRRAFGDQVLDRIDMIYFSGPQLEVRKAAVVGESKETAELVFDRRWPSDHRAVLAVFSLPEKKATSVR